jgi:hypothetical protein
MRRRLATSALLVASGTTAGCFHYVPVETAPPQGTPVAVHLSRPIPVDLGEIALNNVVQVRGEIVRSDPDFLLLSAFAVQSALDRELLASGQTVSIPADAVARLEQKRISTVRTALATVALLGAGYLVQLGLRNIGGGDGGEPPPSQQ